MATFNLECYQNEYLDDRATDIDAIVRITAAGTGAARPLVSDAAPSTRAEIIMIDTSGSMDGPCLREARHAAAAAVDCIEDGIRFAVVAGNHLAWRLYPDVPGMALAVRVTVVAGGRPASRAPRPGKRRYRHGSVDRAGSRVGP